MSELFRMETEMTRTTDSNDATEHQDPELAILMQAPIDDEPLTADDERSIVEGWAAYWAQEYLSTSRS